MRHWKPYVRNPFIKMYNTDGKRFICKQVFILSAPLLQLICK